MASLISTIPSTFQLWFTLSVILVVLIFLALDKGPPHHVMLMSVIVLWNVEIFNYSGKPILTVTEALAGFSNSSMITVGGLFVAVAAMDRSRIVHWLAYRVLGQKSGQLWASCKLQIFGFIISAFTNNIPMQALLLPIVCDWCKSRGFPSSKFLLPLNYANIGGGLLATIGSSTNLIINGLLTNAKEAPFGFFEPAYIALPIGVVAILWMLLMHRFLPDNSEIFLKSVRDRSDDMVTAFQLSPGSRHVGKPIHHILSICGLPRGDLLKVWRQGSVLDPEAVVLAVTSSDNAPIKQEHGAAQWKSWVWTFLTGREDAKHYALSGKTAAELGFDRNAKEEVRRPAGVVELTDISDQEVAQAGDTFVFSLRRSVIIETVAQAKHHLLVSSEPAATRVCSKQDFVEVVLGVHSPLVNTPVRGGAHLLEKLYEVGLVAVRKRTASPAAQPVAEQECHKEEDGQKELAVADAREEVFEAGDKLLVLAAPGAELSKDDFLSSNVISPLEKPLTLYLIFPVLLFVAGVTWASIEDTAMVRVSVFMFCFMVLGGWIGTEEVRHVMEWDILILIGSSLALGTALTNSGLASAVSVLVRAAGLGPQGALFLLVTAVVVLNEIVTNNAAATLGIPLAIALTKELGLKSVRPYAMAVLIGGSAAYACPIGYATHMMVLGPGNYTFMDFLKFGTMLDLIYIAGVTVLLPWIFPLNLK